MEKLKELSGFVTWPVVALVALVLAAFVATITLAPPDVLWWLVGAEGLLGTVVGIYMRSPRDARPNHSGAADDSALRSADETWPKGRDRRREGCATADAMALILAVITLSVALAITLSGCTTSAAQRLASAQATVHAAHHSARVEFYNREAARCTTQNDTLDGWESCMIPAIAVQHTADAYRDALMSAQATIDAVGADGAQQAIACAVVAAAHFARSLEAAAVPVPKEVLDIATIVSEVSCGQQ